MIKIPTRNRFKIPKKKLRVLAPRPQTRNHKNGFLQNQTVTQLSLFIFSRNFLRLRFVDDVVVILLEAGLNLSHLVNAWKGSRVSFFSTIFSYFGFLVELD